ncbi:MAG: hypothetical protein EBR82_15050 [Caulobacteraceae bacterium]|nr:hypothetical protein [Caulobacteraceae bacterium]
MALLGKISAVLTANTQDFTRRIGESRRELQDFARQARGVQFNLNTRALDGTLTQLQRFQRTLREIQQLQARGVDAGLPNAGRLRDQFRAFEDIGKPLTSVKNQIEGLSSAIQAELYPELEKIQAGFRNLYRDLDTGAATFDRSAKRIENLQQRLLALSRATAVAKDIGGLSKQLEASSAGSSFFAPSAKEALKKTIALRGEAENIPARFRGGQFADLAVAAEENAARVEKAVARVARAQLRAGRPGGETPRNLEFRGRAQQELDAAVREQSAINALFDRDIRSATIKQVVSPDAVSQVEQLTEKFGKLSARLREGGDQRFDGLIASVGRVVERLNQGETSAKKTKLAIEALAGAEATKSFSAAGFGKADALIRTDSERAIEQIRRDAQKQRNNIIGDNPSLGRRRRAYIEGVNLREDIALSREEFNRTAAGRVNDLSSRVNGIKDAGLTSQFDNIRKLAADANVSLKAAFDGRNTAAGARALDDYKAKFPALIAEIDKFESKLKSAETARKRFDQFLSISGSRSDKLGADLERAASDISVARQFAGNFESGNTSGRRNVAAGIEKQLSAYQKAAELQQRIFDRPQAFKNEEARAKALERVTKVIEAQRRALRDLVVQESKRDGSRGITGAQFDAAANKAAKNRGSFGVGGAAVAQLAFQQGLFAIDDLISATGGLEYKLRAVGNNITQLGLLLGQSGLIPGLSATTGLFLGLSAVIGGQVITSILKYATGSELADDKAKALNDSLSRQKSLVEGLAQAFESLGDSIARKAFSSAGQSTRAFTKELANIDRKQKELREERVSFLDPGVQEERAKQATLKRRLDATSDGGQRVAILREIEESRRRERAAIRARASAPAPSPEDVRKSVVDRIRDSEFARLSEEKGGLFPVRLVDWRARREAEARREKARQDLDAAGADPLSLSRIVEQRIRERQEMATRDIGAFDLFTGDAIEITNAREDVAALTTLLESLRLPASLQADKAIQNIFKSANAAATAIEESQRQVADAIKSGVPTALSLQGLLDRLAGEIDSAQNEIQSAQKDYAESGLTQDDAALRDERIQSARGRIERSREQRLQAQARATELEQRRIIDPQSTLDARRQRAEANLQASGAESGILARRLRELDAMRAKVESEVAARPDSVFVRRRADKELAAINNEAAAIEVATLGLKRFTEALARATAEAESNLQAARQRDDDVRRQSLAPGRGAALPTQDDRDRARKNLEEQQAANRGVEEAVASERDRLERLAQDVNNPLLLTFKRLREIDEQLSSGAGTPLERQRLIQERRRLQDQVDSQIEESPAVRDARDNSTRIEQRQSAEDRGRELAMTPAQRAARESAQQARDLVAEMNRINAPQAVQNEKMSQLALERAQQVAPLVMGFREERLNALLQGPSRAALNVADVNTMEGQRELNRLLRGDDPNRDVNLVELQKQSELLQGVIDAIKEEGGQNVVEIRG